ncbi:MAG: hypothetical protein COV69_03660 [Parcubacteria group bacterium CG11_big_fil_rev_8_21_14_0_20_39_14]|nr:MAG: hypothetical protein COV69_03660 [Parcubacteria group bacterium CG11_big_fil_rev_8_21_14_0_20_39_14]
MSGILSNGVDPPPTLDMAPPTTFCRNYDLRKHLDRQILFKLFNKCNLLNYKKVGGPKHILSALIK